MIEALDDAVGQITQQLSAAHIENQTLIFFISDNGGATFTRATDNAPLRGGKCTHFEGGLLVPFFIKYPDGIRGSRVYENPVSSLDIFATIAALTHAELPAGRIYDGKNLIPFLNGDTGKPHEVFYWRSGYSKAICMGPWKLYVNEKNKKTFLYNLDNDIEEKHDLSATQPDKVKELRHAVDEWERTQTITPSWPSGADLLIEVDGETYFFPS
jgi:arylsulfatase A-like enzyme